MALTYHAGSIIRGTNSDRTGGTWTNLPAGWVFITSDTLDIYYWNGSIWSILASSTGEANTASNVGAGQGVWKAKTGVDLSFRSLTATSSKIALANNTNDIGIDVTEANLTLSNMTGPLSIAKGGTGAITATLGFDALSPMTTAGDIIYGGASGTRTRLAIGTANQLLRVNSGATAPEYASTLSGLTLTAPVISTISNTGTITLPTSTDTLVGKATTDTLTAKTMDTIAGTNNLLGVQTSPLDSKQVGMWHGPIATNSCASGFWAVLFTNNNTGSGGWTINKTSTGVNARADTGNTINSLCGMRCASGNTVVRGDLNTNFGMRAALTNAGANLVRCYIGFTSNTSAAASASDPLNTFSGIGFWFDSGVDTNWHIAQNDGTGASDRTTINAGTAGTGTIKDFWLRSTAATTWQYSFATRGTPYASLSWSNIATDVPAMTTNMGYLWYVEALASTNSKPVDFYGGVGWQDCN
jgi:hypothetical protein